MKLNLRNFNAKNVKIHFPGTEISNRNIKSIFNQKKAEPITKKKPLPEIPDMR